MKKKFNMFKKANNYNTYNEQDENEYLIPKEDNTEVEFKEAISFKPNNLYIVDGSWESDYQTFQMPTDIYNAFSNINYVMIESSNDRDESKKLIRSFLSSVFSMFSNSCVNLSTLILYDAHYAKLIDHPCEDWIEYIYTIIDGALNNYRITLSHILLYGDDEIISNYILHNMNRDINIMINDLGSNIYNFITKKISGYILVKYDNKEDLAKAYNMFNGFFADFMAKLNNESSIFTINLSNVLHFVNYYLSISNFPYEIETREDNGISKISF